MSERVCPVPGCGKAVNGAPQKVYCSVKCRQKVSRIRNNEYNLEYYKKNREKRIEHARKWCQENPEKCRESSRKWKIKNREKLIDYADKYRQKNPEKALSYYNKNKLKVLEKVRQYQQKVLREKAALQLASLQSQLESCLNERSATATTDAER